MAAGTSSFRAPIKDSRQANAGMPVVPQLKTSIDVRKVHNGIAAVIALDYSGPLSR